MSPLRVRQEIEQNVANEPLFQYIEQLAVDYQIGFLSNASSNVLTGLFDEHKVSLFDAAMVSYETGFVKPNNRAYEIIADRLGVLPEECVFVDDLERNVTGAREAGMHGVLYHNFEQAKKRY